MAIISPISLKGPAEVAHGWMFIGFALNVLLMGVMITQVYLYYSKYKHDKAWIKIFVAVLFFVDILNTVFLFVYLYRSLITFFGDADFLSQADWLFATDPATVGIIACSVQLFFAWRVFVLTKTWVYSAAIASLAIAGGVSSIVTAIEVGRTPRFVDFQNFKQTVIVWLAAEAVGDVVITTILVWYLLSSNILTNGVPKRKHKTGFQRSDMIVDRIIRISVQTGLLTMIVASLDLVFFLLDPSGTHLLFNFPLSKLYSNSLMSSLNSRRGWKYGATSSGAESEGQVNTTGNLKQRNIQLSTMKPNDMINLDTRTHPEVFVHVESHELRDVESGTKGAFDDKPRTLNSQSSVDKSEDKASWPVGREWSAT